MALQVPERSRHLGEGSAIAQGAGLALDYREIVSPSRLIMGSLDDPFLRRSEKRAR